MHRVLAGLALLCSASLAAGCGESQARLTGVHTFVTPAWLTRIVHHEATLLSDKHPRGMEITFAKRRDVVEMLGEFRTPAATLHGTSVRIVADPHTHRVLSVTLGRRIAHRQALEIARRSSSFLNVFRAVPGTIACSIPRGGPGSVHLRGRCTTAFVLSPPYRRGAIRVRFVERWRDGGRGRQGGWIVTVRLLDGRVLGIHLTGQEPPQLWR